MEEGELSCDHEDEDDDAWAEHGRHALLRTDGEALALCAARAPLLSRVDCLRPFPYLSLCSAMRRFDIEVIQLFTRLRGRATQKS